MLFLHFESRWDIGIPFINLQCCSKFGKTVFTSPPLVTLFPSAICFSKQSSVIMPSSSPNRINILKRAPHVHTSSALQRIAPAHEPIIISCIIYDHLLVDWWLTSMILWSSWAIFDIGPFVMPNRSRKETTNCTNLIYHLRAPNASREST